MSDRKEEIAALLRNEPYEIIAYHAYPTGFLRDGILLHCADSRNPGDENERKLIDTVETAHREARRQAQLNTRFIDNKSAVEIRVSGYKESLYLVNFDGAYTVTSGVNGHGGTVYALQKN